MELNTHDSSHNFTLVPNFGIAHFQGAELTPTDVFPAPVVERSWTLSDLSASAQLQPDPSPIEPQDDSLVWLISQARELVERYRDEWILIDQCTVIAHSTDPRTLETVAQQRGISAPFITKVVPDTAVWRTAYAG